MNIKNERKRNCWNLNTWIDHKRRGWRQKAKKKTWNTRNGQLLSESTLILFFQEIVSIVTIIDVKTKREKEEETNFLYRLFASSMLRLNSSLLLSEWVSDTQIEHWKIWWNMTSFQIHTHSRHSWINLNFLTPFIAIMTLKGCDHGSC